MSDKPGRQNCCHVSKNGNPCNRPSREHGYCTKCVKLKLVQKKLGLSPQSTPPAKSLQPAQPANEEEKEPKVKAPGYLWDEADNEEEKDDLHTQMDKVLEDQKESQGPAVPIEEGVEDGVRMESEPEEEATPKYSFSSRFLLTTGLSTVAQIAESKLALLYGVEEELVNNEMLLDALEELTDGNLMASLEEMDPTTRAGVLIAMSCASRVAINVSSGIPSEELEKMVAEKVRNRFKARGIRQQPTY